MNEKKILQELSRINQNIAKLLDRLPPERLYSIAEVAELTSYSQTTVRRMISDGRLGAKREGRRTLVPQSSLTRLQTSMGVGPLAQS